VRRALAAALVLLLAGAGPARGAGADAAQEGVFAALRDTICAGYAAKDADKILAAYAPDARVATFTAGVLTREGFDRLVRNDIVQYQSMKADLDAYQIAVTGNEAEVVLRLTLTGVRPTGETKVRNDRLYLRMHREGAWRIRVQTYRKDFSLPEGTPGGHQ
jgi:ketosteroid isomerase-like protein